MKRNRQIYIAQLSLDNELFYKIGYSRLYKERMTQFYPYTAKVMFLSQGTTDFLSSEKTLLEYVSRSKYQPLHEFGGQSECFIVDDVDIVIDKATSFLTEEANYITEFVPIEGPYGYHDRPKKYSARRKASPSTETSPIPPATFFDDCDVTISANHNVLIRLVKYIEHYGSIQRDLRPVLLLDKIRGMKQIIKNHLVMGEDGLLVLKIS